MPRKIPDLEHTLMKCASEIFVQKGYTEVSMRDVAAAAGTSVGNLYNYFPSKKELFIAGRKVWLGRVKEQFTNEVETTNDPRAALERMLFQLLEQLQTWSGMWEEFVASATRDLKKEEIAVLLEEARAGVVESIILPVDSLVRRLAAGNPALKTILGENDLRFASSLISTLKMLVRFYANQKEENRRYLGRILDSLLVEAK